MADLGKVQISRFHMMVHVQVLPCRQAVALQTHAGQFCETHLTLIKSYFLSTKYFCIACLKVNQVGLSI